LFCFLAHLNDAFLDARIFGITTFGMMGMTTLSMSVECLYAGGRILIDLLSVIILMDVFYCYAECHYTDGCIFIFMLSVAFL
jgi:hypothetical protein